jgi:hypothetical protein
VRRAQREQLAGHRSSSEASSVSSRSMRASLAAMIPT